MKNKVRSYLNFAVIGAAVLFAAIPLSNLLVAGPSEVEVDSQVAVIEETEAVSEDAVSALMAGNAVGASRDCSFGLRIPASAFVP